MPPRRASCLVFGSFLCVIGAGFTLTVLLLARDGWLGWRRDRAARRLAEAPAAPPTD